MKFLATTAFFVSVFICLTLGQESELTVQQKFLARQSAPLVEYEATRLMEARNSKGKTQAKVELKTWLLEGKLLHYQILSESKEDSMTGRKIYKSMLELLESERKEVQTGAFKKSGFLAENYNFWKAEDLGGTFQLSLKAKRKDGLLINGMIFVHPNGELIRSEGVLTKNPSFFISRTFIVFTYAEIFGVTLPTHYDSEVRIKMLGEWTFSTEYKYQSVNGRLVPEN